MALHGFKPNLVEAYRAQPWITYACSTGLPVLTSSLDFSTWQHYVPACLQSRLYFAPDPTRAYPDTGEINMRLFSRMVPLKVVTFPKFAQAHPKFVVLNASWFDDYVHSADSPYSYKIDSQAKFVSLYNDEYGVHPVDVKFQTVERN